MRMESPTHQTVITNMHTVELLHRVLDYAESLGYGVRFEYLGGVASGACEVLGRKWIFVDLALNPLEQLEQVTSALRGDPRVGGDVIPSAVRPTFAARRAA